MSNYQFDYASGRPQMYDHKSRVARAKRIVKVLKDHFGEKKLDQLDILDVGASTGIIDNELAKHFKSVTGIDIDDKAVTFASKKFRRKNLVFKRGDALDLKLRKNSFDVVICAQVYEHVAQPTKMFSEIYKVLKLGGVCYLAALNKYWIMEPHYKLPFLSWLPKNIAHKYVSFLGKAKYYYETPLSYWELRKLTRKFKTIDYTTKILSNPKKFGYQINRIPKPLTIPLKYLVPTFFWLLEK